MEPNENLKLAIEGIEPKYYCRGERDFAYELYYQLRLLEWPSKVEITSESQKNRFSYNAPIFDNEIIKKYFFNNTQNINRKIYRYPDLLIHEFDNRNNQILAVEIKKNCGHINILRDLAKLAIYCKGELNYEKGILIVVGTLSTNAIASPEIKELLKEFQEIEIWTLSPSTKIEIIKYI